jgi:hypothetical protein
MDDPYGRVTEEQQARYAVGAYQRAQEDWPWVGVINYWFFKRASDLEQDQPWYYFRLLEPDFTPTEAWEAYKVYATSTEGAEAIAQSNLDRGWEQLKPALALASGAVLFYWLLGFLSPKP